ncbi:MAG: DUF2802 domain-containing protein [Steroidobacteraceae bacterium]
MIMNIGTVLSIAGAALGLLGLLTALSAHRAVRGWKARCLAVESNLEAMRRELQLAASVSVKAGRRVKRIEQEYSNVADRVGQVELRGTAPSFDHAIESARRGTDQGKLTQQFGLSSGEADLVMRLHGRRKTA